jgi:hypothetical protein
MRGMSMVMALARLEAKTREAEESSERIGQHLARLGAGASVCKNSLPLVR